jgi:hypothetical protein
MQLSCMLLYCWYKLHIREFHEAQAKLGRAWRWLAELGNEPDSADGLVCLEDAIFDALQHLLDLLLPPKLPMDNELALEGCQRHYAQLMQWKCCGK